MYVDDPYGLLMWDPYSGAAPPVLSLMTGMPLWLVLFVGLAIAGLRLRVTPWPAALLGIGAAVLLFASIGGTFLSIGARVTGLEYRLTGGGLWQGVEVVGDLLEVIGLGLLLGAIFVGRVRGVDETKDGEERA